MDAVRQSRQALAGRVPLIGFAGSPWTLATYMVEGGTGHDFRRVKGLLFEAPRLLHELLDKLTRAVTAYLKAQAQAGAQVLMVFDTWGGVLSTHAYDEFSLRYLAEVVAGVQAAPAPPPVILFTKGGGGWIEPIAATGCEAVGLDWTQDLGATRRRVGHRVHYRAISTRWRSTPPRAHPGRGEHAAGELRHRHRPCLQPRPRHRARHRSGARAGARGRRARVQRALSFRGRAIRD